MENSKFKRLSEVNIVEEATEGAHVLIEEDDEIKRVPVANLGGGTKGLVVELTATYTGR